MRDSDMIMFAAIGSTVHLALKALYTRIWNGRRAEGTPARRCVSSHCVENDHIYEDEDA